MNPPLKSSSFRFLLAAHACAIATVVHGDRAGLWQGGHGAVSAVLGGGFTSSANCIYALMGGIVRSDDGAGRVVR